MNSESTPNQAEILLDVFLQTFDGNVLILDEDGRIVLIQHEMCRSDTSTGASPSQEWSGRHFSEFYWHIGAIRKTSYEAVKAGIDSVLSGAQQRISLQHSLPDADDNRWYQIEAQRIDMKSKGWIVVKEFEITEQKHTLESLQESEERYRTLFEQATVGVTLLDLETRQPIQFNDYMCTHLGYTREEFQLLRLDDLEASESSADITRHTHKIVEKGQDVFETQLRDKAGRIRDFHMQVSAVCFQAKPYLLGICLDITERKQTENRLRMLNQAIENSINAFDIVDHEGKFIYVNQAYVDMWGFDKAEEIIGTTPAGHCQDPNLPQKIIGELKKNGQYILEFKAKRKNGSLFDVLMYALHDYDIDGKEVYFATSLDITERKKNETELLQTRNTLNEAQKIAHLGSWEYIAATQTTVWSEEEYQIFGLDPTKNSPTYPTMLQEHVHPEDMSLLNDTFMQALKTQSVYELKEHRIVRPDGTVRWIADRAHPYFDEQGELVRYIGVSLDITEIKQAYEKLETYQKQLKSLTSQLTLAEENLKKTIAMQLHDNLCQQLVMVRVNAGLLAREVDDEEIHTSLKEMYDTVGSLIDDTRNLTTDLSYPELHLFGFEEAVRKWSLSEIQRAHGIEVRLHFDDHTKPLSEEVKVVLFRGVRELLMNVVKHAQAESVEIEIDRFEDNIAVKVSDNGKGFDTTTLVENEGYGFGLLSVSETLDRLGGHLEYESKPGHGYVAQMVAPLDLSYQDTTD